MYHASIRASFARVLRSRGFGLLAFGLAGLCTVMDAHAGAQVDINASISPDPVVRGKAARITFSVRAHPPATGTPTGTVQITSDQPAAVCTVTLPTNNCGFQLDADVHFTIFYSGDANFDSFGIQKTISTVPQTQTTLGSSKNPAPVGQNVVLSSQVAGNLPTGSITFRDGNVVICANVAMSSARAQCATSNLQPGNHTITAVYSGDNNNGTSTSPQLNQVVSNSTAMNLNQFGLTGTWYNKATSGQGFLLAFYPDFGGSGQGFAAGGWFTYDVAPAGQANKQRWYSISGNAVAGAPSAAMTIYTAKGGNFATGPTISSVPVGTGTLGFIDCATATFDYTFTDGTNRTGSVPLTRLTSNVTCGTTGDNGTTPGDFLLSGAWYDPNASGQGLLFDLNTTQSVLSAAWYTYAPNGANLDPSVSQRWYSLQGTFTPGSHTVTNAGIFASTGGVFDDGSYKATPTQVGTATLTFSSCVKASLAYTFTAGSNAGLSGTIALTRIGPAPPGCNF